MTVVKSNPMKLRGPWVEGYTLDLYSISSTFLGYDGSIPRFDTKYTEVGELVNRLKYRGDSAALPSLIDTAEQFVRGLNWTFDCIVPVPPSITRKSQPVAENRERACVSFRSSSLRRRGGQDEGNTAHEGYRLPGRPSKYASQCISCRPEQGPGKTSIATR